MFKIARLNVSGLILLSAIVIASLAGLFILRSIAPSLVAVHLIYVLTAGILAILILKIDFEIFEAFAPHLYVISILFLLLPLIVGQVTRGTVRWIQIGEFTLQPSEIVRPFLILFWSKYAVSRNLNLIQLIKLLFLFIVPIILIVIQPSLGVSILTAIGFLGVIISSGFSKRILFGGLLILILLLPIGYLILQPYQRERINTFIQPNTDPLGAGYNSIQSMISVGSGKIFGRGFGEGVQTQLAFLPEAHTDFIFAAIAEELGLLGVSLILVTILVILISLTGIIDHAVNKVSQAYITGTVLMLFTQSFVHIGMNMGLLPITGIPLPFVSAGGSALIATYIGVAIAVKGKK